MSESRPSISLVIPVYNEAERLAGTLRSIAAWLAAPPCSPAELVLADDGSEDNTLELLRTFQANRRNDMVQVLSLPHRGKAATVRSGMLAARGEFTLFSDADLSVPLEDAVRLVEALDAGADVAIGSREVQGASREREPFYRHMMGRVFNRVVQTLLVPGIQDTQCGFKMFRRKAGRAAFQALRRHGAHAPLVKGPLVTAFDVELMFVARRLGYEIAEVPVRWTHGRGSKVRPLLDSLRMLGDVGSVRWHAWRGHYNPD